LDVPLPPIAEQQRMAAILREQIAAVERARGAAEAQLAAEGVLERAVLRRAFHDIVPLAIGHDRAKEPKGWCWAQLSDVARLESGHTPSRGRPEWWGGDIPWIALPDIRNLDGKVAYDTLEHTNEQGIANSSARVLPAGTVVLSRTASVGFVTIMGRPMATSQDFVNWVCGPQLDPRLLALLLISSRAYIRSLASGAVHKTVYVPTVKKFQVCIPPFREQQQIAATVRKQLTAAECGRDALEAQLAAIKALPAALLRQAFSGEL